MGHQLMVQQDHFGGWHIDRIVQVAGITDPQDTHRGHAQIHFRQAHERQSGGTNIAPRQQVAGPRPGNMQDRQIVGQIIDHYPAVIGRVLVEPAPMKGLRGAGGGK